MSNPYPHQTPHGTLPIDIRVKDKTGPVIITYEVLGTKQKREYPNYVEGLEQARDIAGFEGVSNVCISNK